MASRTYDLVVFGATGFTGKLTAQYITRSFPTNIKWAIAGRSQSKLETVADELKRINPNRSPPTVEVAQLNDAELTALAKKTKLLITTVGPYHIYGTPVLEACAKNGTHYLDVTGEVPWTLEMVNKYNDTAKASGAIIIPQCGLESVPADMMTFAVAMQLRRNNLTAKEMLYTVHAIKGGLSGGTQATVLGLFDNYSLLHIAKSGSPSSMCPIPVPKSQAKPTLMQRFTGYRTEPGLDTVTTSMVGRSDVPIIYRSWGLLSSTESYGPNFSFKPYMSVRSALVGTIVHVVANIAPLILALSPLRWALKQFTLASGEGPSEEASKSEFFEVRGLAIPDQEGARRSFGRMRYDGGIYQFTAITVGEAAMTILSDDDTPAKRLGGGLMTPATLGQPYLERLGNAGLDFQTKMMDA
ncbi:MAG: hypothetical protein M1828_000974 [Chrysothrix sp. TS-e1954]|nr:MAG: hypothetical protein M1828_000974 [Chrysothrix sp. TS-e1954]